MQFEFETLGVERTHRPSLMEEGVKIIRQAWDQGRIGFSGQRWRFPDLPFSPQPERRIPIYFGGNAPSPCSGRCVSATASSRQPRQHRAVKANTPAGRGHEGRGKTPESFPSCSRPRSTWAIRPSRPGRMCSGIAYQMSRYVDWGTDQSSLVQALKADDLLPRISPDRNAGTSGREPGRALPRRALSAGLLLGTPARLEYASGSTQPRALPVRGRARSSPRPSR